MLLQESTYVHYDVLLIDVIMYVHKIFIFSVKLVYTILQLNINRNSEKLLVTIRDHKIILTGFDA